MIAADRTCGSVQNTVGQHRGFVTSVIPASVLNHYFSAHSRSRMLLLLLSICILTVRAPAPTTPPADATTTKWETNARGAATSLASETLSSLVAENQVVIFSKSNCWASRKVKTYFEDAGIPYYSLELDQRGDGESLKKALASKTGSGKTPAVYIRGHLISDSDVSHAYKTGELSHWASSEDDSSSVVMAAE